MCGDKGQVLGHPVVKVLGDPLTLGADRVARLLRL
jgi:hypothetical protein